MLIKDTQNVSNRVIYAPLMSCETVLSGDLRKIGIVL
jgi:hypothetical protein